jgi:hypothetical protein
LRDLNQMNINSDRYLRLTGISILALLLWVGLMSMISIDIEYLWVFLIITIVILVVITIFVVLYVFELIAPHDYDVFSKVYNSVLDYLTIENITAVLVILLLRNVYWFIATHINFQTKKHYQVELLGGKRKASTHDKR